MRWVKLVLVALVLGAMTPAVADAQSELSAAQIGQFNRLFSEGTAIINRYMILSDRESEPLDTQQINRGIRLLDEALTIYPDSWQAHWFRGKAYQAMADNRSALAAFRAAYAINPRQQAVVNEMTIVATDLGELDFAQEAVRQGLVDFPGDLALSARLALILLLKGEIDESIAAADRALEIAPGDQITSLIRRMALEVKSGTRPQPRSVADLQRQS
jgi:tetratricopeptide (TPR) repeat protein